MILSQNFWQWLEFRQNRRADGIPWLVVEALELLPCFSDQKVWSWTGGKIPSSPCSSETKTVAQTCPPLLRAPGDGWNLTLKGKRFKELNLESNGLVRLSSKQKILPFSVRRLYLVGHGHFLVLIQKTKNQTIQENFQQKCNDTHTQQYPLKCLTAAISCANEMDVAPHKMGLDWVSTGGSRYTVQSTLQCS